MATPDSPDPAPEFDTSQPTIARVYDALLGGKDNFAADREGAATYLKYVPDAGRCAIENREALRPLLAALPERERTVLLLRFFESLTQTQIAVPSKSVD